MADTPRKPKNRVFLLRSKMREGPEPSWEAKTADLKPDVELQEHQKRVTKKLKTAPGLLLYHGLGSGKTLSSIAPTEGMDTDVVVPASLRENYKKELKKFTTTPDRRHVMSYEAAGKSLKPKGENSALVVDEAHRLGNAGTGRSQAILKAAPGYKKRILLTGTPIRNHPYELAPLAHTIDPGDNTLPLDPKAFNAKFIAQEKVDPGFLKRYFLGVKPGVREKAQNLKDIRKAFHGKVDYYQPSQDNFPERRDRVVRVPMDTEQADIYNTVINKANPALARKIRDNFPLSKQESSDLNAFLTGPRIAANAPEVYGGHHPSTKFLQALHDFQHEAKNNPDHKAVTYSNFVEGGVDPYAKMLDEAGIPHGVFKGGLSDKERAHLVDQYNSGAIKNLLITGAGSEGLDLKGTRGIQILEPAWNSPRIEQVAGRGIRYGSHEDLPLDQRNVQVSRYHTALPKTFWQRFRNTPSDTTVDEYLYGLSQKKDALNEQFLKVLREEGSVE
jgi:SNF2 family DNA or RNA helicase